MPPFNEEQIQTLAQRHQLNWSPTQVQQLQTLIGGHPSWFDSRCITLPKTISASTSC
ncbi:MAG: hypothetical protein HC810_05965 [Acaryochloridaceae cyanobacterium RL_2_7]|nr:hypothetical protein [Acaryochloridaceae cyanobacterium RL_2_7]